MYPQSFEGKLAMPESTVWAHGPDGTEWHRVTRRWGGSLPTACGQYVRGPVQLRNTVPDAHLCRDCRKVGTRTRNAWRPLLDSLPPIWPPETPATAA